MSLDTNQNAALEAENERLRKRLQELTTDLHYAQNTLKAAGLGQPLLASGVSAEAIMAFESELARLSKERNALAGVYSLKFMAAIGLDAKRQAITEMQRGLAPINAALARLTSREEASSGQ